jgi:hypothetical protein
MRTAESAEPLIVDTQHLGRGFVIMEPHARPEDAVEHFRLNAVARLILEAQFTCHGLAYASQRESARDRAVRKANSIRQRLGWLPGVLNGIGDKPKGMHWSTFERLIADHNRLWSLG